MHPNNILAWQRHAPVRIAGSDCRNFDISEMVRFTFIHFPLPTLSASGARLRSQTVPKDFEFSENSCAQASSANSQNVKISLIEQIEQKEFEGKPSQVRGKRGGGSGRSGRDRRLRHKLQPAQF